MKKDCASDGEQPNLKRKISVFKKAHYSISSNEDPNEEESKEGFVEVTQQRGRQMATVMQDIYSVKFSVKKRSKSSSFYADKD